MTDSHMTDAARRAATAAIVAKRDAILAERSELIEKRTEILSRLRRLDRDLADCRSAARLFDLSIEFPPDEREELERISAQRMAESADLQRARNALAHALGPAPAKPQEPPLAPRPPAPVSATTRPSVREFVLHQLSAAAPSGIKAAALRDAYERRYGRVVHEKTVGMTLYRLLNDELVTRDGHVWFFAQSQPAGVKNPGGSAPGSIGK